MLRDIYVYVYMHMLHICTVTTDEEGGHEFEGEWGGSIWEGVKGGKGREKCCQ